MILPHFEGFSPMFLSLIGVEHSENQALSPSSLSAAWHCLGLCLWCKMVKIRILRTVQKKYLSYGFSCIVRSSDTITHADAKVLILELLQDKSSKAWCIINKKTRFAFLQALYHDLPKHREDLEGPYPFLQIPVTLLFQPPARPIPQMNNCNILILNVFLNNIWERNQTFILSMLPRELWAAQSH